MNFLKTSLSGLKRFSFAICILVLWASLFGATTFYVAPNGNDAWSGKLASPNGSKTDGPFLTPPRARDALREARKNGSGPFVVELREGTYPLSETLVLGAGDSDSTWRSFPNERAVLSGGRFISGFQESMVNGKKRWTTTVPEVKSGSQTFRQLFVSTRGQPYERRFRPNLGMKRVDGLTYSPRRKAASHRAAQIDFIFAPGDFKNWENLGDVEVVCLHIWSSSRLLVKSVDTTRNVVTFTGMPTFAVDQGGLQHYFIENVKEELDEPGEWYLDRPTGVLTYLPKDGESLATTRVVAPVLSTVVSLSANYSKESFVSHVVLSNLVISHNESPLPAEGYGGSQGQPDLPSAVELTGAKECEIVRCVVSQTGNYGIGIGLGCQDNRVLGCRLFDLGGGGIKVGDVKMNDISKNAKYPVLPARNRVENCAISDGGVMYFSANAVWAGIVNGTVIAHNEFWNFPYSGIAVGWSWSDEKTSCASNAIEYNIVSNVLTLLGDGASVYTLGRQPGTVIRGNVVRDNTQSIFAKYHWQLGLYLDEGSSEMLVEKNFVWKVGTHGFNMNGGAQNLIRNNLLGPVYGNEDPYIRCYKKDFSKGNVFEHNVSWCDSENLADEPWDTSLMSCRSNLYWNFTGKPVLFKTKTFAQWQAGGQDIGSVYADPLFQNPERGDFRLKKNSPVPSIGFEMPDVSLAGLEAAFKDLNKKVEVNPPPCYTMKPPVAKEFSGFSWDFEDAPIGATPRGFVPSGFTEAGNFVISEEAAKDGKRALKLTDSKSMAKSFYPFMSQQLPKHYDQGTISFSCDVMVKAEAPCTLDINFRDYSKRASKNKEFVSGPSVQFNASGKIISGTEELLTAKPGTWTHLEIRFTMGSHEASVSLLTAAGEKKEATLSLPADFVALSWLGLIGGDSVDGAAYLDNLKMTITP